MVSVPSAGTATVTAGEITYEHTGTDELVDTFTYSISDASGQESNTATVTVTIEAAPVVDNAPVALAGDAMVPNQGTVVIDVKSNDTDEAPIAESTITMVSVPSAGTATVTAGLIMYEHTGTDELVDTFTYSISLSLIHI